MAAITTIARPKVPSGWRRAKPNAASRQERRISSGASVMAVIALSSTEADARIEPRVEDVDQEVRDHEDGDRQHHQRLGKSVILVLDGQHEQPAEAALVEDLISHDGAADQEG